MYGNMYVDYVNLIGDNLRNAYMSLNSCTFINLLVINLLVIILLVNIGKLSMWKLDAFGS